MNELRARASEVSEAVLKALARRTARLVDLVERATQTSSRREVREGGARLVELLGEKLEEIQDLQAMEDEDLADRVKSFDLRLRMAEAKVTTWPKVKVKAASHDGPRRPPKRSKTPKPTRHAA